MPLSMCVVASVCVRVLGVRVEALFLFTRLSATCSCLRVTSPELLSGGAVSSSGAVSAAGDRRHAKRC